MISSLSKEILSKGYRKYFLRNKKARFHPSLFLFLFTKNLLDRVRHSVVAGRASHAPASTELAGAQACLWTPWQAARKIQESLPPVIGRWRRPLAGEHAHPIGRRGSSCFRLRRNTWSWLATPMKARNGVHKARGSVELRPCGRTSENLVSASAKTARGSAHGRRVENPSLRPELVQATRHAETRV